MRAQNRIVFGETCKEKFTGLNLTNKTTDGSSLAASPDFLVNCWETGGGGSVGVVRYEEINSKHTQPTLFKGHKGLIHDIQICPFYSTIFATASEDGTVKLWDCPPTRVGDTFRDSVATLTGHDRKVCFSAFNQVAEWIIVSGGADCTVRTWDLEVQHCVKTITMPQIPFCAKWNWTGSLLGITTKDKALHIVDPRQNEITQSVQCHEGAKPLRCEWLGGIHASTNTYILTGGFSRQAEREIALWDTRNLVGAIQRVGIDRQASVLQPTYDEGTGLVFLFGKGDGNIRIFECVDGSLNRIGAFMSGDPARDLSFLPKRAVNVSKCEVMRAYKSVGNRSIQPISFFVPRKNTSEFPIDVYPPCFVGDAALTSEEWLKGNSRDPILASMEPVNGVSPFVASKRPVNVGSLTFERTRENTAVRAAPSVLSKELAGKDIATESLSERILELEAELREKTRLLAESEAARLGAVDLTPSTLMSSPPLLSSSPSAAGGLLWLSSTGPSPRGLEMDISRISVAQEQMKEVQTTARATTAELKTLCEEAQLTKEQLDQIRRLMKDSIASSGSSSQRTGTQDGVKIRADGFVDETVGGGQSDDREVITDVTYIVDLLLRRIAKVEKRNRALRNKTTVLETLFRRLRQSSATHATKNNDDPVEWTGN